MATQRPARAEWNGSTRDKRATFVDSTIRRPSYYVLVQCTPGVGQNAPRCGTTFRRDKVTRLGDVMVFHPGKWQGGTGPKLKNASSWALFLSFFFFENCITTLIQFPTIITYHRNTFSHQPKNLSKCLADPTKRTSMNPPA